MGFRVIRGRISTRRLERAGVPRSVAMQLVGDKTENIYRRYAIVAEAVHPLYFTVYLGALCHASVAWRCPAFERKTQAIQGTISPRFGSVRRRSGGS